MIVQKILNLRLFGKVYEQRRARCYKKSGLLTASYVFRLCLRELQGTGCTLWPPAFCPFQAMFYTYIIEISLTAVFIRPVSTVIITITDPWCSDTATCVVTLQLVFTTCYTVTTNTVSQNVLAASSCHIYQLKLQLQCLYHCSTFTHKTVKEWKHHSLQFSSDQSPQLL